MQKNINFVFLKYYIEVQGNKSKIMAFIFSQIFNRQNNTRTQKKIYIYIFELFTMLRISKNWIDIFQHEEKL